MNSNFTDDCKLEQLLKELNSRNSQKRAIAVKKLGQMDIKIKDFPIILHTKLEETLFDPEAEVRKEAAMALAFLEGEIALLLLEALLDDPVLSVRSNAIAAISFIGVTPPRIITDKMINFLTAPEVEIRDRCARACGRLKIFQAKEKLLELARIDSSPAVRAGAIVGLGMLEDPQIKMDLRQLLSSETSPPVISAIKETIALIETSIARNNLQV
ncbi:MAG: HEAT repeat domain-containing protein [Candidatus Hodarchaeota archaeon]